MGEAAENNNMHSVRSVCPRSTTSTRWCLRYNLRREAAPPSSLTRCSASHAAPKTNLLTKPAISATSQKRAIPYCAAGIIVPYQGKRRPGLLPPQSSPDVPPSVACTPRSATCLPPKASTGPQCSLKALRVTPPTGSSAAERGLGATVAQDKDRHSRCAALVNR